MSKGVKGFIKAKQVKRAIQLGIRQIGAGNHLEKWRSSKLAEFVRRQEKAFKVSMVKSAGNTFFNGLTDQFRSLYILRLGATAFELGLVNSIAGIAGTAIALPTGWFADRHGIRRVFLLGSPLIILGSLLFGLALDWRLTIRARERELRRKMKRKG